LALDRLMEDDATGFETEPAGLELVWRDLSETRTPSPKVWMDSYLAAFAITGGMRLAALDKDFRKFEAKGLDLLILSPWGEESKLGVRGMEGSKEGGEIL